MNTEDLSLALQILRGMTLEECAREFFISPGAVSKALKRLQDQLGYSLFCREGRRLVPTVQGRRALPLIAETLAHLEALRSDETNPHPETIFGRVDRLLLYRLGHEPEATIRSWQSRPDDAGALEAARQQGGRAIVGPEGLQRAERRGWICQEVGHHQRVTAAAPGTVAQPLHVDELITRPIGAVLASGGTWVDGWRDDQFRRTHIIGYNDYGLFLTGILRGHHLGYLWQGIAEAWGLETLKVAGCPFVCQETHYLCTPPKV